jgi:hypothetical protein
MPHISVRISVGTPVTDPAAHPGCSNPKISSDIECEYPRSGFGIQQAYVIREA